jgi:hypothetical protein
VASFFLKKLAHEDTAGSPSLTTHVQPDPAMPNPRRPVEGDV